VINPKGAKMNFKLLQKRLFLFSVFLIILFVNFQPSVLQAQVRFDITPSYGFLLSTNVRAAQGDVVIVDSPDFGLTIDIGHERLPGGMMIQLMYNRQDTRMELKEYPSGVRKELFDLIVEYWQLGVVRPLQMGKVQPYGVVGLGAASFNPIGSTWGTEWFFAAHFGGGVKVALSESVGLRFQGRALLPMTFGGGGFWCGTGGCGIGLGSYSSFIQFDFNGGIVIFLGGKK
jgi:hypothetical protein